MGCRSISFPDALQVQKTEREGETGVRERQKEEERISLFRVSYFFY